MKKLRNSLQTKEAGILMERPALNLSKIFYRIGYNGNATAAVLICNCVFEVFNSSDFFDVV